MLSRRSFLTASALTAGTTFLLGQGSSTRASAATATLPLSLQNNSGNDTVYAYISGLDSSGWPGFVGADGQFNRLPSPSGPLTPIADYAIQLGPSGGAATGVTLQEYVISGRVWFSSGTRLQFFVNPGGTPGLVQPGFTPSDPNWQTDWTFCEFTFDSSNLYANLSYVDMVSSPVSIQVTGSSGQQTVSPLPSGALASIASGLQAQHASDGAPWDQLVSTDGNGNVLRVLSPMHSPADFGSYWAGYLNGAWAHYESNGLTIDTQWFGSFTGTVKDGVLTFDGLNTNGVPFTQPSAIDIFSCASGPLYNSGGDVRGAVATRLAAALNRSTLLLGGGDNQPSGVHPAAYYKDPTTNHYARLVHQYASVGYAFPYDDVCPNWATAVDGHVQDSAPTACKISFGGPVG
ncbi:beta-1,3-glucanase family protein [Streptomyces sp. NPDC048527]|uniref:beta-1,3-glucanase family protein n=1 Tax=Streptomyces sp. NPDC048527 TaxID=3365568 RepID=UPI003713841F